MPGWFILIGSATALVLQTKPARPVTTNRNGAMRSDKQAKKNKAAQPLLVPAQIGSLRRAQMIEREASDIPPRPHPPTHITHKHYKICKPVNDLPRQLNWLHRRRAQPVRRVAIHAHCFLVPFANNSSNPIQAIPFVLFGLIGANCIRSC